MRGNIRLICFFVFAAFTPLMAHAAYDLPYVGDIIEYETNDIDTFVHLARDYNLGFTELRAANPYVDPWLPGAGKDLILPTRHILPDAPRKGIVINVAEMRLFAYFGPNGEPYSYPIGVGREGLNTPIGRTTIVRKAEGPTWTPTERMRKEKPELKPFYGPGPDNPMGTHALYLGFPQYAIHGTNRPFGIGRRTSSGCIRMYPESIIEVFDMAPVGTPVEIVNQPIKLAWIEDKLYLEAHPTLEQSIEYEERGVAQEQKMTNAEMKYLIKMAGDQADRLNWPVIRMALKERKGYPVQIARRPGVVADAGDVSDEPAKAVSMNIPKEAHSLVDDKKAKEEKAVNKREVLDVPANFDEPAIMINSNSTTPARNYFND